MKVLLRYGAEIFSRKQFLNVGLPGYEQAGQRLIVVPVALKILAAICSAEICVEERNHEIHNYKTLL
jgi:hypothetical protein